MKAVNKNKRMKAEVKSRIAELEKRKEMAEFQRRITTQLMVAWEYDAEIDAINRALQRLKII